MPSLLKRRLQRLPSYVSAFGWYHGARLMIVNERNADRRSQPKRRYRVPGFDWPIWLRDTVSDRSIFWQCFVMRQYALTDFRQTDRLLQRYRETLAGGARPLIVDCGGNVGLSAIWFTKHFPEAEIRVLEPDRDNFEVLKENTAPYGDRIHPILGGIWNSGQDLVVENPDAGAAALRFDEARGAGQPAVPGYSMAQVLEQAERKHCLIVKLDIEGAQKALFEKNTEWVGKVDLIIIELDDWQFPWAGTSRPFLRCVSQYPFDYLLKGENLFCFRDSEASGGAELAIKA